MLQQFSLIILFTFHKIYKSEKNSRIKLYKELNRLVGIELPIIFTNHEKYLILCNPWVSFTWNPFSFNYLKYIYIDKKLKKKSLKLTR